MAPAQTIAKFAKLNPTLEFVGAISAEGKFLSADEVKSLATLPGKLWSCQIVIEDHDATTGALRTQVAVDFLMKITNCPSTNATPVFSKTLQAKTVPHMLKQ